MLLLRIAANEQIGKEFRLLAKAKEQLERSDEHMDYRALNTDMTLGDLEAWVKSQGEYFNSQMNWVFKTIQDYMERVKHRYMREYMPGKNKFFDEYHKAWEADAANGAGAGRYTLNDATVYYENLFKTYTGVDPQGNEVAFNNYELKDESDPSLRAYERAFIKNVKAEVEKSVKAIVAKKIKDGEIANYASADAWYEDNYRGQEGLLPIVTANMGERLAKGSVKGGINAYVEQNTNFNNLSLGTEKNLNRRNAAGLATANIGTGFGSYERIGRLGLSMEGEKVVVADPGRNASGSTDVQTLLDYFVYMNMKMEHEAEFTTVHAAAKTILLTQEVRAGKDRENELKTLDAVFDLLIYNERQEIQAAGRLNLAKVADTLRNVTTGATLSFNLQSAFLATFGDMYSMYSNALAKRYGKAFFGAGDLNKALGLMASDNKKFNDLIDLFLFQDMDESALIFSDKYKEGYKGVAKSRYSRIQQHMGERMVRGMLLVSQLYHDGLVDKFSYDENGQLSYDWSRDERGAIGQTILAKVQRRGTEFLPYDDVMLRSLSAIAGKMYGAFNDAERGRMDTNAIVQFFGQFRKFIVARGNELLSRGFENENIRWYEMIEEEGAQKVNVRLFYQEGIYQSVVHLFKESRRLSGQDASAWQSMRPEQRANIRKLYDYVTEGELLEGIKADWIESSQLLLSRA
ncbi:hypothetical protein DC20_02665 [Rufibacter tibetensis]|uniref:Uncharacterized protein n=1 Tax=Rufibacter tibetensis TaxID=512763 RepID=A0A0P0CUN2_9BACT|nr:hypothetical protein DC20_02665 [Rufibacter tibetensis]